MTKLVHRIQQMLADNKEFSWLAVLGAASVVLSLALVLYFEPEELFWKIILASISELGFACLIAYFIIVAVDFHEKAEFHAYIKRSERRVASKALLSYMLDLELPDAVSRKLQMLIASSTIIKRYQNITFRLQKLDDVWAELIGHYEYVGYNAAPNAVTEPLEFYFDFDPNSPVASRGDTGLRRISIEKKVSGAADFAVTESSIIASSGLSAGSFTTEIELQPLEEFRVRFETRGVKQLSDNEVWRSQHLCEALRAEIHFDPEQFSVAYSVIHPGSIIEGRSDGSSILRINVSEPLLRSNGFLFWWQYLTKPLANPTVEPETQL